MQASRNDFTIIKKQVSSGNRIVIDFWLQHVWLWKQDRAQTPETFFEIGKISRFATM